MRPLPPTQPTFNNNTEYYRWLLNQLTATIGLETFSMKQLSEMTEDESLTGRHGIRYSIELGIDKGCSVAYQLEAIMDSARFNYIVDGSKGPRDKVHFRLETNDDKVYLDYTGKHPAEDSRGHFAHVFTTVIARFGSVCATRYGLSVRRCAEKPQSTGAPARFPTNGAPLDMKECTEWIRQKYGAECKCIVTLRVAAISQDQAESLPKDIEVIKSITQLAENDADRPFSRSTSISFDQLETSRPESVASNITFTGTEYSDDAGSSASFERLSMQQ
ncbi:hypothetical protein AAVH_23017 [Aphelenchoides avenae]|nr:hypothetical protein AAVH_23017 [Aphelenchus avenae]